MRASRANSNLRLSYSTTVNRPEFRELAEFEFTDVVGNRAVKGNAEPAAGPDPERGRPVGDVHRRARRRRRQRLLQVLRQADRARRHRVGQPDRHVPELPTTPGTSASSWRRGSSSAHFFVNANYTFVDSKITLLPRAARRPDVARAAAGRPVGEPVQPTGEFALRRLLDAAALQLLRRPHLGRRRQRGAGHHRAGARRARRGVGAADARPDRPR